MAQRVMATHNVEMLGRDQRATESVCVHDGGAVAWRRFDIVAMLVHQDGCDQQRLTVRQIVGHDVRSAEAFHADTDTDDHVLKHALTIRVEFFKQSLNCYCIGVRLLKVESEQSNIHELLIKYRHTSIFPTSRIFNSVQ